MNIVTFRRSHFFPGAITNEDFNLQVGDNVFELDKENPSKDLKIAMDTQATLNELKALKIPEVETALDKIDYYFDPAVYDIPIKNETPEKILVLIDPKDVYPKKSTFISTGISEVLCKGRLTEGSSFSEFALCCVGLFNSVAIDMISSSTKSGQMIFTWCGNGEAALRANSEKMQMDFINGLITQNRNEDKRVLSELLKLSEKYC